MYEVYVPKSRGCKKDIILIPLLRHWKYVFLALTHRNIPSKHPPIALCVGVATVQVSSCLELDNSNKRQERLCFLGIKHLFKTTLLVKCGPTNKLHILNKSYRHVKKLPSPIKWCPGGFRDYSAKHPNQPYFDSTPLSNA